MRFTFDNLIDPETGERVSVDVPLKEYLSLKFGKRRTEVEQIKVRVTAFAHRCKSIRPPEIYDK